MNKIIISGNLGADPEVREFNGKQQLTMNVAVRRSYKNKDGQYESDWFRVVDFMDSRIKFITEHFHKGDGIIVEGHVQTGSYTKQDGTKGYSFDVMVNNVEFGPGKRSGSDAQTATNRPVATTAAAPDPQAGIPTDSGYESSLPWS